MLVVLAALSVCSCDDIIRDVFGDAGSGSSEPKRTLVDFELGYDTKQSLLEKILGIDSHVFRSFTDEEQFQRIQQTGSLRDDYLKNKFEFDSETSLFRVEPLPRKCKVDEIWVESSDTSVIRIDYVSGSGVALRTVGFGETDLRVIVRSGAKEVAKVYPMAVVGTTNLNFYITPYWLGGVHTRIRYKVKGLPENISSLVMEVQDSVTVIGECAYYDHYRYGSRPQVVRDTVTFPVEKRMSMFRKGYRVLVRNITSAVRKFDDSSIEGTYVKIVDGKRDTVKTYYGYKTEQVILTMAFVTDNPYLEFMLNSKCGRSTQSLVGGGSDADEYDPDDASEPDGSDVETFNYFTVMVNDFLTQHQKDSIRRSIDDMKEKYGFREYASEEDKQKALDEINKYL